MGLIWLACAVPLFATVTDTVLTVGADITVVREVRPLSVGRGEQEILLTGIPEQADLSTLTLRLRRVPVQLLEWQWAGLDEDGLGTVRARIHMPVGGQHAFEVTYQVGGIFWQVDYQITPNTSGGGWDHERSRVMFVGRAHLENLTGRTFADARILLVGADPRQPRRAERRPGSLQLGDSPLAEAWRPVRPDPPMTHRYALPQRLDVPARTTTTTEWIRADNVSATALYVMNARDIPLTMETEDYPLARHLLLLNRTAEGLGWPLPPGDVRVAMPPGNSIKGRLAHTPVNAEIRLEVGPDERVRGRRERLFRTVVREGRFEEMYHLWVHNQHDRAIDVEAVEESRSTQQGTVIHATHEYEIRAGAFRMRTAIPAGETWTADLRLRVRASE